MWEEMRRNVVLLSFLMEGELLPQADLLMECGCVVRGDFIWFYPFTTLPGISARQNKHQLSNIKTFLSLHGTSD
jgi:hypothetical protein